MIKSITEQLSQKLKREKEELERKHEEAMTKQKTQYEEEKD